MDESERPADEGRREQHSSVLGLLPPHEFILSEFDPDSGLCDTCGTPESAAIHHHKDPLARMANALERLAESNEEIAGALHELVNGHTENISDRLARVESTPRPSPELMKRLDVLEETLTQLRRDLIRAGL